MSDVVQYDPADPVVAGRVTLHRKSVNTPDWNGLPNTLVNPDLTGLYNPATRVYTVPLAYWKESGGSIVEMIQAEKDAIDAIPTPTEPRLRMVAALVAGTTKTITDQSPNWGFVGSTVGRAGFLISDLTRAIAHVTMAIKTTGTGAELRLVEATPTSDVTCKEVTLPDTSGAWSVHEFSTIPGVDPVPRDEIAEYRLEGQVDGSSTLEIRSADLSLIEIVG